MSATPRGPGVLYVVATPIGNLDDLTIRARDALARCDAILAEDTRRTRKLLSHLGISRPLRTLNAHATEGSIDHVAREVAGGAELCLVSDAGTPLVSDPGAELVSAVIEAGGRVVAIPGASAVLTALVSSGLGRGGFRFFGFLPRSGRERADALATIVETPEAVVIYEAGNRTKQTLVDLAARMPSRPAAVARELTKLHEEVSRGAIEDLARRIDDDVRGEVTIVLGADAGPKEVMSDGAVDAHIDRALEGGQSVKGAADIVAALSGRPRREVYARILARRGPRSRDG